MAELPGHCNLERGWDCEDLTDVVGGDFPELFGVGFFDERFVVAVDDVGGVAGAFGNLPCGNRVPGFAKRFAKRLLLFLIFLTKVIKKIIFILLIISKFIL